MDKLEYISGEEWRDIGGYEGLYQVSSFGNIRRLTTKAGNYRPHLLKLTFTHSGVKTFLCKNNHTIGYMVDKLVALSFIDNPYNKKYIYHIDGNVLNNSISNIVWATVEDAVGLCKSNDTTEEIWKEIPSMEGLYQVSSLGRVRSLPRVVTIYNGGSYILPSTIIEQHPRKEGYMQVKLCLNGQMKSYSVHRLVALAFVPNPNGWTDINHKDEVKTNNIPSNLEWCTKAYNTKYGTRTFRTSKPVEMYDLNGNYIKTFLSIRKASEEMGIPAANIRNCAKCSLLKDNKGKLYNVRSAGGYKWKYANKEQLQHLLFGLGINHEMEV